MADNDYNSMAKFLMGQSPSAAYPQAVNHGLNLARPLMPQAGAAPLVPGSAPPMTLYHGSRTGELKLSDTSPSFNFYGRQGLYLSDNPSIARNYANGMEARPGDKLGNGRVFTVEVRPSKTLKGDAPLAEMAEPIKAGILKEAEGLSSVGMSVLRDNLSTIGPHSTPQDLAYHFTAAAFLGKALKSLGYDSISSGKPGNTEFVLLDPSKGRVLP